MKHLMIMLTILVGLVGLSGCDQAQKARIKSEIEKVNRECPIDMGMIGTVTSISYDEDDNMIVYNCTLNDELINIDDLKNNKSSYLKSLRLTLNREEMRKMLEVFVDAGASLSYKFKSDSTGDSVNFTISNDEMKEILDNPMSQDESGRMFLENSIAIEAKRCPYYVDEGMEMISVVDDGSYVVYTCSIDNDLYDIEMLELLGDDLKKEVDGLFNDPSLQMLVQVMGQLDKGLIYRFVDNVTGKSADITFSSDEIKQKARRSAAINNFR